MKTLILSDAHLNVAPDGRETMADLVAFLRALDPTAHERIIILGDLFDFWFEYRHVIFSGYFDVLRAFADLRDAGVAFDFFCGNHDFWVGRFLEEDLGFTVYRAPTVLTIGTRRVLFAHGDGVNPRDRGYRVYKRFARFPLIVGLFRLLHPDWAMWLAQRVARGSRNMNQARNLSAGPEVGPLEDFARETLAEGRADVVLCGHSHYPTEKTFPTPKGDGLYINTGDWMLHRSYVEWEDGRFRLVVPTKPGAP
jgi:UDP-2,3-diacylglucosamine hydrolase